METNTPNLSPERALGLADKVVGQAVPDENRSSLYY